ncbi:MAG: Gfo/Idh/MocA family protein [Planctomycetota bacterium]|jgi:predicted dehydrogenase
MVRNWVSFTEMSGDHIIEQHVHNIDVANWFIGHPPRRALGFGGRARRKTGNQFDFFSVQYDYRDDCHIHSMCRQVDGCYERTSEHLVGTEGSVWGSGDIRSAFDKRIDIPEFSEHEGPYVQEHVDLLTGILEGKPLNEARNVAESTLTAIMGRISAYTGQLVRWIDLTDPSANSPWYDLVLKPTAQDLETGNVQAPPDDVVPIPGKEKEEDD